MEIQNINLAQSLPARQSIYLSFRAVKIFLIVFLSILFITYSIFLVVNLFKSSNYKTLAKEKAALNNQIAAIIEQVEKTKVNTALVDGIDNLKAKIRNNDRVLDLMNSEKQSRFSSYLQSIATIIPDDVWLEEITVSPSEEYINLIGHSLKATAISQFADQLSTTEIFTNFKFSSVNITQKGTDQFNFNISSKKSPPKTEVEQK